MAEGNADVARDSREWKLPEYLEQTDGGVLVRLGRVRWGQVVMTAALVMIIVSPVAVRAPDVAGWVVGGVLGVIVLCAAPILMVWWRYGGVVPVAGVRLAARIELVSAVVLTAAAIACGVWAAARDIAAEDLFAGTGLYRAAAFLAVVPVIYLCQFAGGLLRVARRVDPQTPPALLPGDRSIRGMYSTDYGEAGVRFPKVLSLALAAPIVAVAWLSVVLANVTSDDEYVIPMVVMGCGIGLVPLVAGVAWWPWLPAALSRGLRPEQVRAVGWTHVVGGCVGGLVGAGALVVLVIPVDGANAAPGLLGILLGGSMLSVAGGQLVSFGNRLRRVGLHPADTGTSTSSPAAEPTSEVSAGGTGRE